MNERMITHSAMTNACAQGEAHPSWVSPQDQDPFQAPDMGETSGTGPLTSWVTKHMPNTVGSQCPYLLTGVQGT